MPTSQPNQLNQIVTAIAATNPQSILDIGTGFGKYGLLAREYLEFWTDNPEYANWKHTIDGIEVFEKYITPLHRYIYSNLYIGEARSVLSQLAKSYDLILLIDVIEHFSHDEGLAFLKLCCKKAKNVIVSTPTHMAEQGGVFGNEYETHKSHWTASEFLTFKNSVQIDPANSSIIIYIGEDYLNIAEKQKRRFSEDWAFLYRLCKRAKRIFSF